MRVWGEVGYDGAPIDSGRIIFTPTGTTAGGSTGGPIVRGKYEITRENGPYAGGTYRVEISSLAKTGKSVPNVGLSDGSRLDLFGEAIPAIYNCTSTLSVTVSSDSSKNRHDFPLKKVMNLKNAQRRPR